jgi:acetolactate synthase-1/2/3 large subunit
VNAPVLALTGQIQQAMIGRNVGLLHELPDQLAIMRGLTKWADRIHAPAEAPGLLNEAFRRLLSGRRRPVGLECAMDTWARKAPVELIATPAEADPCPVDEDAVERAARLLGGAQRPLIVVGGGAQGAGEYVQAIAEMLDAPVMTGRMGQGVLDGRHKLSVTMPAGYRFWGEADVVLAVGTRMQPQQQNWGMDDALKIIRIDIDSEELDRQRRPEIGIVGDATATLKVLAARLGKHNAKRNGRAEEVAETKASAMKIVRDKLAPQISYLEAIRKALPEDGILVDELTQMGYVARLAYPTYKPRTSSRRATRARWAGVTPRRSAQRSPGPTRRSCRSAAMAVSCSRPWRWRRRRSTASASSRSCSATAPTATSSASSSRPSTTAPSPATCAIRIS